MSKPIAERIAEGVVELAAKRTEIDPKQFGDPVLEGPTRGRPGERSRGSTCSRPASGRTRAPARPSMDRKRLASARQTPGQGA